MAEEKLIRRVRFAEESGTGPTKADVHPDEVANYALGGFVVADPGQAAPAKPLPAGELVEKIKAAGSAEEVATLLGNDQRATVVAAATARTAELAQR